MANKPLKSVKFPGLGDTYTIPQVDTTLAVTGAAADSKKVGDELTELKADKADKSEALGSYVVNTASGAIASFPDGADGVPVKDLVAQIVPVQSGSGDPSPTNVRPISGWTGANVSRTGVNLIPNALPSNVIAGTISDNTTIKSATNARICAFRVPKNTDICVQKKGGDSASSGIAFGYTGNISVGTPVYNYNGFTNSATVNTNTGDFDWIYISASNIDNLSAFWTTRELMVSVGSGRKDYVAPKQESYIDVDWTTEAGTVYGGTLDVTTGVLTVDRITKTLDENASWSFSYNSETGLAQVSINNVFASEEVVNNAGTPNYCNQAVFVRSESGTVPAGKFTVRSYARNFRIGIDGITTEEAWISHVTSNPIQICMVLSPSKHVTYQLTPTEVSTLLGLNNIWADTGDVSVDYRADTKLYIEKLTAPTEDDMVANNTIPDATYFMIGNNLYLSTTTIPAGDVINPGTNCTLMNLASALNALNS